MNHSADSFIYTSKIDIIGDVHGQADALADLLKSLNYSKVNGVWQHPERIALFLGDLIDRGDKVKETLYLVRNMVESGKALCIMGNHEYNFIGMFTKGEDGRPLRAHTHRTLSQTGKTIESLKTPAEIRYWREWFLSLPLFFENQHLRAVHAAWFNRYINIIRLKLHQLRFTQRTLEESFNRTTLLSEAVRVILKGPELTLPPKVQILCGRKEVRVKWWQQAKSWTDATFASIEIQEPLPEEYKDTTEPYTKTDKPLFFGHYSFIKTPFIYGTNYTCVDFGGGYKGGCLTAYRFDGEKKLSKEKLQCVKIL